MQKFFLIIVVVFAFQYGMSQKIYNTTSGELIFGFSNANYSTPDANEQLPFNNKPGSITDAMRFTIWFHFGTYWHKDFNNRFGIYTGITNRNIGFITKEASSDLTTTDFVKWKRRSYALGVPIVLKLGSFDDDFYFFAGAQYEVLYHYKEKEFQLTNKRIYSDWFSNRLNIFMPSIFAGITFPKGLSIKITYNLLDMMNRDFSYSNASNQKVYPYKHLDSKLFYISIFKMIRIDKKTYQKTVEERKQVAFL